MSVIKCVYIEMKTEDFWPLLLDEIRHGTEVKGVYDASNATIMPALFSLEDVELLMGMK